MPKINFLQIKSPERKTFEHVITIDENKHTIKLREGNLAQMWAITERVNELKKKYITEKVPIIDSAGNIIRISENLLTTAVTLAFCQVCSSEEDLYTVEDFIRMSVISPDEYMTILNEMMINFSPPKTNDEEKEDGEDPNPFIEV